VKSASAVVIWKWSTCRPCSTILKDWFFFHDQSFALIGKYAQVKSVDAIVRGQVNLISIIRIGNLPVYLFV